MKMKYTRLTKEQFEEMHTEFINFLASQKIDKQEWDLIKAEKPELMEQELDVFSDLIWEGALNKANYMEHYSNSHIFLFHFDQHNIHTIVIKSLNSSIDFMTVEGLRWLSDSVFTDEIEIKHGGRPFVKDRNQEVFEIIKQGAILGDGVLYDQFKDMLKL